MICSRRLYKGNAYEICLPISDTGVTMVRFYTKGDVIIEKEPISTGDTMCFELAENDLASLEDGVLRYEIVTDYETTDTNAPYVVVTPGNYSGNTLEDLLADAYDSGYTAGKEDCSGDTCEGVFDSGYTSGYTDGFDTGYNSGYTDGFDSGKTDGYDSGFTVGYGSGYTDGLNACSGSGNEDLIANLEDRYFVIPEGTTRLRPGAFSYGLPGAYSAESEHAQSLVIPSSVTEIGSCAFYNNGIYSSITIPDSVTSIGAYAFYAMPQLREINIPAGVTEIPMWCFGNSFKSSAETLPSVQPLVFHSGITSLGPSMCDGCTGLTDVVFEGSGITAIPSRAFINCTSLTGITIPDEITTIGANAFCYCPFSSITIPSGVTTMGGYAFASCTNLTGITIPESLNAIPNYAFSNCTGLTEAILPSSLTGISDCAFSSCTQLEEIVIPSGVTSIGARAFEGCIGLTAMTFLGTTPPTLRNPRTSLGPTSYTFPIIVPCEAYDAYMDAFINYRSRIKGTGIEATGINLTCDSAITGTGQAIATLTPLDADAIITYETSDESIATIDSAGTITVVSEGTVGICARFKNICAQRHGVTCKTNVRTYLNPEPEPSGDTAITAITITVPQNLEPGDSGSTSVSTSPTGATINLSYTSSDDSVATIDSAGTITAVGTGTTNICVKDMISQIEECTSLTVGSYVGNGDISATIRPQNTTMATTLCSNSSLGSIDRMTIDGIEITPVSSYTFGDTNLHTLDIWYLSSTIPSDAFEYAERIETAVIKDRMTVIGNRAFFSCTGLTSVQIGSGITAINNSAFQGDKSLTSIVIPDNVNTIGTNVFSGCTSLTSATIGSDVTSISDGMFKDCTGLTELTINGNIGTIGNSAFLQCKSLSAYPFTNTLTTIGGAAFKGCESLSNVVMPDSVTSAGDEAFAGCSGLTAVTLSTGLTEIANYLFSSCSTLHSVSIPDTVSKIGGHSFEQCSTMTGVSLSSGLTEIGDCAFEYCTYLRGIDIPETVTKIGAYSFRFDTAINVNGITVRSAVPSQIGSQAFASTSNSPIYVPAESVETYKNSTTTNHYWATYADRIQPIQ